MDEQSHDISNNNFPLHISSLDFLFLHLTLLSYHLVEIFKFFPPFLVTFPYEFTILYTLHLWSDHQNLFYARQNLFLHRLCIFHPVCM